MNQREREIAKIELTTHKNFELIKPMYENLIEMSVDEIGKLLHEIMNLYITFDAKNDDENDGYHYGIHEHFRCQIDIIVNYLTNDRHLTQQQIDEISMP